MVKKNSDDNEKQKKVKLISNRNVGMDEVQIIQLQIILIALGQFN